LRSRILAALLHGTPAAASAKVCGVEWNYGNFVECATYIFVLWCRFETCCTRIAENAGIRRPIFGWAAITLGIAPHSSSYTDYKHTAVTFNLRIDLFYFMLFHCLYFKGYIFKSRFVIFKLVSPGDRPFKITLQ